MNGFEILRRNDFIGRPFGLTGLQYLVASGSLGVLLFFTFKFFFFEIAVLSNNLFLEPFQYYIVLMSISIIIPALSFGIWYLLRELLVSLNQIVLESRDEINANRMKMDLESSLKQSKLYLCVIILVLLPFLAEDVCNLWRGEPLFFFGSAADPRDTWNLIFCYGFDVFYIVIIYAMNFLIANLIWLVIIMTIIFEKLSRSYRNHISVEILDADGLGGIGHLKSLILKTSLFYFSILALAVVSYKGLPDSTDKTAYLVSYENILFLLMMIIGTGFFFISLRSLKKILRVKVDAQINILVNAYSGLLSHLRDSSQERSNSRNNEITSISIALDSLHREQKRLIQIVGHDYTSIAAFITSLIPPIAAKVLVDLLPSWK